MDENKTRAYEYLVNLNLQLQQLLPASQEMRTLMLEIEKNSDNPHRIRENRFLYYVLPLIHKHMQTVDGIGASEATKAILCEYHNKFPTISSSNGLRKVGHPFGKDRSTSVSAIFEKWIKPTTPYPINQAYPDFSFKSPFPYKIVFDAKYYVSGSKSEAEKALVNGVYEGTFYRGLPRDMTIKQSWDYDYACLLIYDASENGSLKEAWESVANRLPFWNGANIYVMVI